MSEILAPYTDPADAVPHQGVTAGAGAVISTDQFNGLIVGSDGGLFIGGGSVAVFVQEGDGDA